MSNESQTERRPHVVLLHFYEMYRNVKSIKGKKVDQYLHWAGDGNRKSWQKDMRHLLRVTDMF